MLEGLKDLAGGLAEGGIEAILSWVAGVAVSGMLTMLDWLGTWWLDIAAPSMGEGSAASRVIETTRPLLPLFGVLGMALGLVRIGRSPNRESVENLVGSMIRTVISVTLAVSVTALGLEFGTEVSPWLVRTISGETDRTISSLIGGDTVTGSIGTDAALSFVLLLLCIVGLLGALTNAFLVLFSYGMASVLAGLLAFFAATSTTQTGAKSFDRALSWLIAVILFKPVAAVIWGVGLAMAGGMVGDAEQAEGMDRLVGFLIGTVMVGGACLALPGLARAVAPVVAAGPRGMGSGAVMGAIGALATGALMAGASKGLGAGAKGGKSGLANLPQGISSGGPSGGKNSSAPTGNKSNGGAGQEHNGSSAESPGSGSGSASGGGGNLSGGGAAGTGAGSNGKVTGSDGAAPSGDSAGGSTGSDGAAPSGGSAGGSTGSDGAAPSGGSAGGSTGSGNSRGAPGRREKARTAPTNGNGPAGSTQDESGVNGTGSRQSFIQRASQNAGTSARYRMRQVMDETGQAVETGDE